MFLRKTIPALALFLAAGLITAVQSDRLSPYPMTDATVRQWKLPGKLREISGLALAPDGRLFAVADESAVVFEIDYANGALIKAFALGNPAIKGDFEGIAWLNDRLYLTTSDGVLYSSAEGDNGAHLDAERVDTGLGETCEVEGLTEQAETGRLFFVCKARRRGSQSPGLHVWEWSTASREFVGSIRIPIADIEQALKVDDFNPSGIVMDRDGNSFLIVAAKQKSLVQVAADGGLVAARRFRQTSRHKQAEGIELTSSGKLLIADEGGDKKARLAVYEPRPGGEPK
ncbi:MAG: hypothetical protein OEW68_04285 [Gammaproteobacteria bacterium]|nr:hypothetical protein [Gammaproteobacteria bacterium]MDH4314041.1 hypothetical protein [Gammaproteobacteria bacterium]MDH5213519.1 hypothetical protein [Gammaproteobacteria bacterium]MDH5500122.1 hypothetical protein [Gammaproteobacteria bacterium]